MAFGDLTLSADTAVDVDTNTAVYAKRYGDEKKSAFSVAGLTLPTARVLTISHDLGKSGEERHLVRIDRTEVDALGVPATVSVYLNIIRPPSTALTNAIILQALNYLIDFCVEGGANANIVAVLNGEV